MTAASLAAAPTLTFSDKDRLQEIWVDRQIGARSKRAAFPSHRLASSQAFVDGCLAGLGWGMNPNASYHDVINFEHKMDHLVAAVSGLPGSFLFSTGPSYKRKTRGHIDMPLLGCTVTLDGRAVVRDGRIVDPELMV